MKTCEEYVLNELKKTKKELALVKKAKEELEDEHRLALTEYKMLIDLVVQGTEHFRLEDDGTSVKVYLFSYYLLYLNKKDLGKGEGLVNLILKGQSIVRREEDAKMQAVKDASAKTPPARFKLLVQYNNNENDFVFYARCKTEEDAMAMGNLLMEDKKSEVVDFDIIKDEIDDLEGDEGELE